MAAVYNATLKNNRMQLMSDAVNGKTFSASAEAGAAGKLVIGTSALSGATGVLATLVVPNPAFTVAGALATLNGVPLSTAASASGTAALAEFRTSADATVISGLTVGTLAGSDIILSSITVTALGTVTVTAGTINHG